MSDQYPPPSYPPPGGNDQNWPGDQGNQYGQQQPPQYGQQQPPQYGQQQPPQYGQQPGYNDPSSGAGYGAPSSGAGYGDPSSGAGYGAPPPTPPKKRSVGKIIGIVLGILVVLSLICCGGIYFLARDTWDEIVGSQPNNAQAGDCVGGDTIDNSGRVDRNVQAQVVDCTSAEAKYKVIARVEDKTQSEVTSDNGEAVCGQYVDEGAESFLWVGDTTDASAKGVVLCLGPVK